MKIMSQRRVCWTGWLLLAVAPGGFDAIGSSFLQLDLVMPHTLPLSLIFCFHRQNKN